MNARALKALTEAAKTRNPAQREKAIDAWATRWLVTAQSDVTVSDPHPRVVSVELAVATRTFIEQICLGGTGQKVLDISSDGGVGFRLEVTCVRYEAPPALSVVPEKKRRRP